MTDVLVLDSDNTILGSAGSPVPADVLVLDTSNSSGITAAVTNELLVLDTSTVTIESSVPVPSDLIIIDTTHESVAVMDTGADVVVISSSGIQGIPGAQGVKGDIGLSGLQGIAGKNISNAMFTAKGLFIVSVGTARYPIAAAGNIVLTSASLGTAGATATTILIKKNGTTFHTDVIATGANTVSNGTIVSVAANDYITVDISVAGTDAKDLTVLVRIEEQ